ncbi:MAG TPA: hypothetical protein VFZ58_05165 [Candidatus Saccharimonadales bacterium]
MAASRKSPAHSMAAMFSQVHPSPATWAMLWRSNEGNIVLERIGQFLTGFQPDGNWPNPQLRAMFRTSHAHPLYGLEHFTYTPGDLGLLPVRVFPRYNQLNEPLEPPTDSYMGIRFLGIFVRDPCDPYAFWLPNFIVKLQHAHKAIGCTRKEFHQIHLPKLYGEMEDEAIERVWLELQRGGQR